MILSNVHEFIRKLEQGIGDCCRVMLFIPFDGTLGVQINWPEDFHYRRCFSEQEIKYIKDDEIVVSWLIFTAKRAYMKAAVGEEWQQQ